jgi:hypothetical protein
VLAGCFYSEVSLDYQNRGGAITPGRAELSVGQFTDERGLPPFHLGTARNAMGLAAEAVRLRVPAEEAVQNAFLHAMDARGMLAEGNAKYYLSGEIEQLSCEMYTKPYAAVRIHVNVVQAGSGRVVFHRVYTGSRHHPGYLPHYTDPVPMLRELASRALQDAVDKALDDPALRRAVRQGRRPAHKAAR